MHATISIYTHDVALLCIYARQDAHGARREPQLRGLRLNIIIIIIITISGWTRPAEPLRDH